MASLDWFESIAELRATVAKLESKVESAYSAAGPRGQQLGSIGGGSGHDALAGVDQIIDDGAVPELDRKRAELEERMVRATDILYGESGNGGVSKAIGTDEADMLCYHYLQGESWARVARRFEPDTSNLTVWCQRRAAWVCRRIDGIGMDRLADS